MKQPKLETTVGLWRQDDPGETHFVLFTAEGADDVDPEWSVTIPYALWEKWDKPDYAVFEIAVLAKRAEESDED